MTSEKLLKMFRINYQATKVNIEGISDQASLVRPRPAGNSVNWVFGHIIASRKLILELVGEETVLTPGEAFPYRRGAGDEDMPNLTPFSRLKEAFSLSQTSLKRGMQKLSENDLNSVLNKDDGSEQESTLLDSLTFLQFHEAYHVGQLGLLRRLIGIEGAIK